jgi:membrane fusion protein, heavy metal efflux system
MKIKGGIQSKSVKATAFVLVMFCLIPSCSNSVQQEGDEKELSGVVMVSAEQFEASGMMLDSVTRQSFSRTIQANGYIDVPPEYKASVSVKLGGFVKALSILPGNKVKQGSVLFTLENPEFITLQQEYLEAKARLQYLASDYERQKALADENIASQKNFLKAEADYKATQATCQGLGERLKMLNINLARLEEGKIMPNISVHAPIGGYISKVNINRGVYVDANAVAVEIVSTEHRHVELQIFEKDAALVREGQVITFSIQGSTQVHTGEVYLVGKIVEDRARTVNIHGHIENETDDLLPGMYAEARIHIANEHRGALPAEAVVSVDDKHYVLVLTTKDNASYTFTRKTVRVGEFTNQWTEIVNASDFKPDDVFLVKGAFNLIIE